MISRLNRYRPLLVLFAFYVLSCTGLRIFLYGKFRPETFSHPLWSVYAVGLRMDVAAGLALFLPALFWLTFLPERFFISRLHRVLVHGFALFYMGYQLFMLKVEEEFFLEFNSRFNTVAVDYLLYPQEVLVNIWESYPVRTIIAVCAIGAVAIYFLVRPWIRKTWKSPTTLSSRLKFFFGYLILVTLLLSTTRYTQSRLSEDRVTNEIAANGNFSFVYAAFTHHLDYPAFYKTMSAADAYARTRKLVGLRGDIFSPDPLSIERQVTYPGPAKRLNVVVFLVESFGSEFWGALGRNPTLTPEMDALSREGILFDHLYASGNRTVRGMEGVLSSIPPLPGDSIVKRNLSDNVASVARSLKSRGYNTLFLYGGRGVFDGMRSYAMRNGYDRFIEQKDFPKDSFKTIWGVADEILVARGIEELRALHQTGHPFFATFLTVSNHKPYTYPRGRIPENPDDHSRANAVKYTDWALGQFFKAAKKEAFYQDTVFAVVADHGARVYGSQTIPIRSYQIPLIIVGGPIQHRVVSTIGGSLDVGPTLLGFLNESYQSVFFGRDLLRVPPENAWAVMNHNRDISLYRGGRMVVLNLNKGHEAYKMNEQAKDIEPVPFSPEFSDVEQDTMAIYQVADDLYTHQRYHLP